MEIHNPLFRSSRRNRAMVKNPTMDNNNQKPAVQQKEERKVTDKTLLHLEVRRQQSQKMLTQ